MHLKKIIQKKNNLEKINLKANSEKNILLITIMKLNQQLNFYFNNSIITRDAIENLNQKYNIQNYFIQKKQDAKILNKIVSKLKIQQKIKTREKELWIYLKEEQKYSTDSYSRYEKMILENASKKHIEFIAIYKKTEEFLNKNNLKILKTFDSITNETVSSLAKLIKYLYENEGFSRIKFVLNTNKNFDSFFTILPIEEFEINKLITNKENYSSLKKNDFNIYPNVGEYIENSVDIYIENVMQSLIIESMFYSAKLGLVRVNKIIKDLEKEIKAVKRKIIKIKRELEIEEIVMLTQNNSKFSLLSKGEKNE
ncbi:MSC_0622 family F1-like ATPase gamma subunit [Mesomycoplasma molare]|uniref:ATP synthase gamma chain n=1 Tax=Mesomycoplasma molare TaxID=171288 RepID=A0ABY5TT65_9BACT|nr:hypothetical protein [Mesomycoplasma molare]UWD33873.1 hypothetical protein NX772_02060 [Mesomycoplasma molare]